MLMLQGSTCSQHRGPSRSNESRKFYGAFCAGTFEFANWNDPRPTHCAGPWGYSSGDHYGYFRPPPWISHECYENVDVSVLNRREGAREKWDEAKWEVNRGSQPICLREGTKQNKTKQCLAKSSLASTLRNGNTITI